MDGGKHGGKVTLFSESVGYSGHSKNLRAKNSVDRRDGANRTTTPPAEPKNMRATSASGRARCAGSGRVDTHNPDNQCIERHTTDKPYDKRDRSVAPRVPGFTHGSESGFKATKAKKQDQHGLDPSSGRNGRRNNCGFAMTGNSNKPHADDCKQGQNLGDGEDVVNARAGLDAEEVDCGEKPD